MPWFREKHPDPVVSIHPEAATDAGISEGDWVQVETPIGVVRQKARLTDALPRRDMAVARAAMPRDWRLAGHPERQPSAGLFEVRDDLLAPEPDLLLDLFL
jgi:thiosulfate reductase/polysulfide reductase chain A